MTKRISWLRRLLWSLLILAGAVVLGVLVLMLSLRHPLPQAAPSLAADVLAHSVQQAVNVDAWNQTGAIRWRFREHEHLWDRGRSLARVRWGDHEVLLRLADQSGVARKNGQPVAAPEARKLIGSAYRFFINDSFWLNPLAKLFDDGVVRAEVPFSGRTALLLRYQLGGVTPGDSYLWILDQNNRPLAWRIWASILPIGGLETSWEGWITLKTGAVVSTEHRIGRFQMLTLRDVAGAASLSELAPGPDPFQLLLSDRDK